MRWPVVINLSPSLPLSPSRPCCPASSRRKKEAALPSGRRCSCSSSLALATGSSDAPKVFFWFIHSAGICTQKCWESTTTKQPLTNCITTTKIVYDEVRNPALHLVLHHIRTLARLRLPWALGPKDVRPGFTHPFSNTRGPCCPATMSSGSRLAWR